MPAAKGDRQDDSNRSRGRGRASIHSCPAKGVCTPLACGRVLRMGQRRPPARASAGGRRQRPAATVARAATVKCSADESSRCAAGCCGDLCRRRASGRGAGRAAANRSLRRRSPRRRPAIRRRCRAGGEPGSHPAGTSRLRAGHHRGRRPLFSEIPLRHLRRRRRRDDRPHADLFAGNPTRRSGSVP